MVVNYTLRSLPVVYNDLRKSVKWYDDQFENLGNEFRTEVNKEFDYILKYPEHYQIRHDNIRLAIVNRFPYFIYYFINNADSEIVITGVIHNKRNPDFLKKRISK